MEKEFILLLDHSVDSFNNASHLGDIARCICLYDGELVTLVFESRHADHETSFFHELLNVSEASIYETEVSSL